MSDEAPHQPPRKAGSSRGPWSLVGVGVELGGAVALMTLAGWWLDRRWNSGPWLMLTGMGVGLIGGMYNLYKEGKRHFHD
jgi:F0F1-type ATP synthase assembly protein I